MVHFYQDELIDVHNGKHAIDLFTIHERRGLRRKGIIERGPKRNYVLSPRTKAILEAIKEYFIEVKTDWDTR